MTNLSKCWQSHYVAIQTFQAFFFTVCEKESKSKTHEIDCCCYNESESGKKARKERKKNCGHCFIRIVSAAGMQL